MSRGGAIYDFDMIRFQGPTVPFEFSIAIATTATRIIGNDPDRLMVVMTNNDAGPIYWSTRPFASATDGFAVGSGIATLLQVQNDGALCGVELWGLAPAGPFTLHIAGIRRQSRG